MSDSVLEEIKARVDLADLISSYGVNVRTAGASKKACCPFHHEKTPSFNINTSKGYYHCFGCGESGDAISFVMKMDGLPFMDAVRKLADRCNVKIEQRDDPTAGKRKRLLALMAELAQFYRRCLLKTKEAQLARDYLASRDLGDEAQENFLIGYAPNGTATILKWAAKYGYTPEDLADAGVIKLPNRPGDTGYHRFGGRLMFSIRDRQGRVVAFSGRQLVASKNSGKYVNSPETLIFKKSEVLFGLDRASPNIVKAPHREAIVCEGQIDTIRLHVSGFPVAVASQGTAFTEEHVRILGKVADQVVLVFDDDAAGHKATIRTAGLFLAAGLPVRVVSLPGGEDPDSFLRKNGPADFQKLLDNAESIMSAQVRMERAKEKDPASVDAVARITRGILATIAQSRNAVIRAGMVTEAAGLLGLPASALQEELGKCIVPSGQCIVPSDSPAPSTKHQALSTPSPAPSTKHQALSTAGEAGSAGETAAPPLHEQALMDMLLANEYDAKLREIVLKCLPAKVFEHDFTRRFVETWCAEAAGEDDLMTPFAAGLPPHERKWFDHALVNGGHSQGSGVDTDAHLKNLVCDLWADAFSRRLLELPPYGTSPETDDERMRIAMERKNLSERDWPDVEKIIARHIAE